MAHYPKWAVDQTTTFIDEWCASNNRTIIPGERRNLIREVLSIWPSGVDSAIHRSTVGARGGSRPGAGRKPVQSRCPCGAMSAARAAKRNHKCEFARDMRADMQGGGKS
jgi:hypothetical protein